jgi:hypothetical protein
MRTVRTVRVTRWPVLPVMLRDLQRMLEPLTPRQRKDFKQMMHRLVLANNATARHAT